MGQMHLYLNYARRHWTNDDENPPVGIVLCACKPVAKRTGVDQCGEKVTPADRVNTLSCARPRQPEETLRTRDEAVGCVAVGLSVPLEVIGIVMQRRHFQYRKTHH